MLQIRELSKTYPNGVQALKKVTLDIPKGMFGLLGPNGAGKSSLMRTLATLQEADSGSVLFEAVDVLKHIPRKSSRIILKALLSAAANARASRAWTGTRP